MVERFVGIDVALREHRIAVLDRYGESAPRSDQLAVGEPKWVRTPPVRRLTLR